MPIRYFIMKSSNLRNLEISQQKGIWSTTPSNERKLNRAFWESSVVYLIFSVQGSGHFQVRNLYSARLFIQPAVLATENPDTVSRIYYRNPELLLFSFAFHPVNCDLF